MLGRRPGACPQRRPGGGRSGAGSGQALQHLGNGRIGGGGRHLVLPEIQETAGKVGGIGGIGHAARTQR